MKILEQWKSGESQKINNSDMARLSKWQHPLDSGIYIAMLVALKKVIFFYMSTESALERGVWLLILAQDASSRGLTNWAFTHYFLLDFLLFRFFIWALPLGSKDLAVSCPSYTNLKKKKVLIRNKKLDYLKLNKLSLQNL